MNTTVKSAAWLALLPRMLAPFFLLIGSAAATAGWELDSERSSVQFLSVKNAMIAELHHFKSLTGGVNDEGAAQIVIDLDSVETLIPIRNERLRKMLFETIQFPAATLQVDVPDTLTGLAAGETAQLALPVTVEFHGKSKSYDAQLQATKLADGSLEVSVLEPLVVYADDFELAEGILALKEIAGLTSISTAVPVTARLRFNPEG
ncbi:MAG: YceI family protein [Pseudomonadota bacterium]